MSCDICGSKEGLVGRATRSCGKGRKLLVIENVPVVICSSCGESYLIADALHEIERIKLQRKRIVCQRPVAVASFA
jgi:YgiT-type zinc finger domain-containing protein